MTAALSAVMAILAAFRERVRASWRVFDKRLKRVEEHQLTQQRQLEAIRQGQVTIHKNQEEALRLLRELTGEFPEFRAQTEKRLYELERDRERERPVRN